MSIKRLALSAFAAITLAACTQIGTGEVGVKTTIGGKVSPEELTQGFHFVPPVFMSVQKFTGKELKVNITDKPMLPVSVENQELEKFDAEVYYYVINSEIADIDIKYENNHEKVDGIWAPSRDLVYSTSRSAARNTVSKIKSLDITSSRDQIVEDMKRTIQAALDQSDPDTFVITKVIIRDIKPNKSVALSAAKNVNKQNEAEAIEKEVGIAKTQASINRELSPSITPELLQMRKLDIDEKRIDMMLQACSKGPCTFFIDSGASDVSPILPVAPTSPSQ